MATNGQMQGAYTNDAKISEVISHMYIRSRQAYEGQTGYPECWRDQLEPDEVDDWADTLALADRERRHFRKGLVAIKALAEAHVDELDELGTICRTALAVLNGPLPEELDDDD